MGWKAVGGFVLVLAGFGGWEGDVVGWVGVTLPRRWHCRGGCLLARRAESRAVFARVAIAAFGG